MKCLACVGNGGTGGVGASSWIRPKSDGTGGVALGACKDVGPRLEGRPGLNVRREGCKSGNANVICGCSHSAPGSGETLPGARGRARGRHVSGKGGKREGRRRRGVRQGRKKVWQAGRVVQTADYASNQPGGVPARPGARPNKPGRGGEGCQTVASG